MATTKTLTPTNQAITLAAFTEKPDNRTNVTNDDKLADAVNALNSNMETYELATQSTLAGVESALNTLIGTMGDKTTRVVKIQVSASFGVFISGIYQGTVRKWNSSRVYVELYSANGDANGTLLSGDWGWSSLTSNKQAKLLSKTISATTDATGDVSLDLATETYVPVAFHISGGAVSKSASMLFMQNGNGTNWWIKFVSDSTLQNEANKTVEGTLYYFST